MDMIRRTLLKGMGSAGVLSAALAAGMLKPTGAWAQEWNRGAFEAKDFSAAIKAIGATTTSESKDILLKAPDIAENGAVVPVDVVSNVPNTISIAILVDKNPYPLSSAFDFANGAVPEISVRLKLSQTSNVKAVAKTADGKYFHAMKEVKVTVGGCGG
jgi:sulfur-oxidizing protein SoxY